METLAVKKEEVLYVGDSYVDVQCAKKAGVTSGAALWGCVNVEAVLDEGPDLVVNSVSRGPYLLDDADTTILNYLRYEL